MTEHKSIEEIAKLFHETYERLAPQYGYETRADTKEFDKDSPNGKLMIAVIAELIPHLNSRNLFPDKNKDFEKWANDWLHRFGMANRTWLWDKYKDSLSSVIDDLRVSTTTKNEGTSLTLGMLEEMYNRAFASEELKTEMDNALKGNGIPDNSRNLLERFVDWLPKKFWEDEDHAVGGYISKRDLKAKLDEFIESEGLK